jgi:predicted Zn-dependent protease
VPILQHGPRRSIRLDPARGNRLFSAALPVPGNQNHPMSQPSDRLRALREAVRIAPDDASLRRLLGNALLQDGAADEAEAEFRAALRLDPEDASARMGLVQAFRAQQKLSAALVVLEEEARAGRGGAEVQMLLARLLLETGETARAQRAGTGA